MDIATSLADGGLDSPARPIHAHLNAQETEFLRKKVDAMPDGRLKTALLLAVHPEHEGAKRKLDRRRGSVQDLHAFNARMAGKVSSSFDVTLALDLGGIEMGNAGALQLAELLQSPALRRLRHLDLSCNKLTDLGSTFTGVGALATALKKNRVLTSLNLARNSLFKNGAISMARALKENSTIKFLDLSRNNLRAEGLEAIAKAIDSKQNPVSGVTVLDLSCNNLTNFAGSPDGAIALSAAISTHKRLTCLDLSHSRMSKAALTALAFALSRNHSLIDLRLDDNKVDLDTANQLAEALAMNRSLTRLGLYDNVIFNDGAVAIARTMCRNPVLQLVDMRKCYVTKEGRLEIAALLRPDAPAVKSALSASSAVADAVATSTAPAGGDDSDDEVPAALKKAAGAGAGAGAGSASAPAGDEETKGVEGELQHLDVATPAIADKRAPPPSPVKPRHVADVDLDADEVVLHSVQSGHTIWL